MATEDIFIPGKFTDFTDKQQLFLLNELLIQILNRLNQIDPGSIALAELAGHTAGHVIASNGAGVAPTWEETITLLNLTVSGLTASMVVATDAAKQLTTPANLPAIKVAGLTVGIGTAGTDYPITFDGETNDGVITWMEDEDYFSFNDDVMIPTGERIYFGDTGSSIRYDGAHFNFVDDTNIEFNSPIIEFGQNLHADTTVRFMGDHNDGSMVWREDENYLDFEDAVRLAAGTTANAPVTFQDGPLLATPVAGSMEFSDGRWYITGTGKQRVLDRTCGVIAATTTIANSNAEATLWTETLSANTMKVGRLYKIHCDGIISNHSNDDDITLNFYVGGVLHATITPLTKTYAASPWHADFNFTVRTVGAGGTSAVQGHMLIGALDTWFNSLQALDTTAANSMTIKAKWNTASAANTISVYQGWLELKN
jgi:hypothetical protein